jgi:hypothetical protein
MRKNFRILLFCVLSLFMYLIPYGHNTSVTSAAVVVVCGEGKLRLVDALVGRSWLSQSHRFHYHTAPLSPSSYISLNIAYC